MLLTTKEFASKYNVSHEAILWRVRKNKIKYTEKYGVILISDKTVYEPVRGRGRKA